MAINKDPKRTLGYVITVSLEIALDIKDLDLLKGLQAYFGVGGIYKHSGNMMRYKVSSARDLARVVIPHFEKYPLVTQKRADFEIFKSAIGILNSGGISSEELQKIVNLRASLNRGLSSTLQASFPNTVPVERRFIPFIAPLHPLWVVGFADAESNFYIGFTKKSSCKLGMTARLVFALTQHSRDKNLLQGFIEFFGCGYYTERNNKLAGDFKVYNLEDISSKIIPFFLKYPLMGSKLLPFNDFCKAANIINEKGHLTQEGLDMLQNIKSRTGTI